MAMNAESLENKARDAFVRLQTCSRTERGGFSERLLAALSPVPESIASLGNANQASVFVLRRFLKVQAR
jgi:hypothetical protein